MGGKKSKEPTSKDMKLVVRKSRACEENLTSSDKIRKHIVMQFGYRMLSLARQGMIAPPEELWGLTELQKLNLSLNCLCFLPSSVALLQNLVVLNLWGNQLTSLPLEIGQLRNLKVLFAYHNHLTDVPEELGSCTKLEVLSLANNQLTSLPDSLSALTNLRKLNLSHNNIVYIPVCVYAMKKLVFLHVARNKLENIAEHIQALTDLKILIVEENCIHCLPKMLCCLTKLELLNVDYNDIQNVPAEMHQLNRLGKLASHPLDKGLHIVHNPLLKPIKEVLDGGLQALYNYLKAEWYAVLWELKCGLFDCLDYFSFRATHNYLRIHKLLKLANGVLHCFIKKTKKTIITNIFIRKTKMKKMKTNTNVQLIYLML